MKKAESTRIERMLILGCAACSMIGIPNHHMIECHHILQGNRRMGHWFTIPLCAGHHRGMFTASQRSQLELAQLVSVSDGRKMFNLVFDTERVLWEKVQFLLALNDTWTKSKIVARRAA